MLDMRYGKVIAATTISLVIAALAVVAAKRSTSSSASATPKYTVAQVSRGDIVQAIDSTGQLVPSVSVEVSSQISGLLSEVNVDFNSRVRKGHVLARIDSATFEQRLRQSKADLAAAKASAALNHRTVDRLKGLLAQDLVTQETYDQALAELEQAQSLLLTREAALENAQVDLERCTILSPIDGVVIYKQAEVGKTVVSSFSAPTLFVIAQDLAKMRIVAPISEVDVQNVRPGQDVTFTVDAFANRSFHGKIVQIRNPYTPSEKQAGTSAQSSSGITAFDAVIEVDNPDLALRPSLTATVSIEIARSTDVLRIPTGALRVSPPARVPPMAPRGMVPSPGNIEASLVTVYRTSTSDRSAPLEAVLVMIGLTDSVNAEVRVGLREGDTVVTGLSGQIELGPAPSIF